MPVELSDQEALALANLLGDLNDQLEAEFNQREEDADIWAAELRERSGPPREPIRQWVQEHEYRWVVPEDQDVDDVVDSIIYTIQKNAASEAPSR